MKGELENEPLPEEKAKKYFCQILKGLEYLHRHRIIHRDIKPENLLVTVDGTVKISDFGVSHVFDNEHDESLKKTVGSPAFLPPELCSCVAAETSKIVAPAIDIWALGVTLYCLIIGKCPFMADTEVRIYEQITTQEVQFPHKINADLEDLIRKMLVKDPEKRIIIKDIKKHPWVVSEFSKC